MKDLTDRIDNTPASTEIDAQTLQELDRYATDFVAGVRRSFARAIWLEHAAQMTANALPTMHRSNWSTWLLRKFSKS